MSHIGFGSFLLFAGSGLIAGARLRGRTTDPLNEPITGRKGQRVYVFVGVALIILGVAVLAGLT